ncbi:hypothetical protein ANCCAN_13221 [Ancylostoma caninum]|uniref:Uncharacterized protein n=1 Tax=Ancylostoma caninum TaxID=29170 RepID=A0A368G913_ANCCA|nr:hypothetical protein ANCCAN_13221 [Ancylostoma caninum]
MAVIGKVREWGETDWDCGADNFWPSKVAAKIQAEIACKRIYEKINDACKRHDRCYSKKAQTQLECDKVLVHSVILQRYN